MSKAVPLEDICETTFYVPLSRETIAQYERGELDEAGFMRAITQSEHIYALPNPDWLGYALEQFKNMPALFEAAAGGEIIAGADGEAFLPAYLESAARIIADPAVYKTPEEVQEFSLLLGQISEKEFCKNNKKAFKKHAVPVFWDAFCALRGVYQKAAEQNLCLAILAGYEEAHHEQTD